MAIAFSFTEGYTGKILVVYVQLPGELRGDTLDAVVTEDQVAEVGQVSHFWRNGWDEVPTQIQQLQTSRKKKTRVNFGLAMLNSSTE